MRSSAKTTFGLIWAMCSLVIVVSLTFFASERNGWWSLGRLDSVFPFIDVDTVGKHVIDSWL